MKEPKDPREVGPKPPFREAEQASPGSQSAMQQQPDVGERSYRGHARLAERIALITGADSGIGRAVALAFAREGSDVVISFLNEEEDANETKRLVESAGRKALTIAGDLADEAQCKRVVDVAVKQFGRIDLLINNAAFQGKAVETFEELTGERIRRTFATNIEAMFHLTRYALPSMKPGSAIINTASIQAYQPSPSILDYAATKGAIVTFTKGLAQILIERGIRVNCVAPGPVWTPLIAQSYGEEKIAQFGEGTPMQRPAQPAEMAPLYVFLASEESRYVNGEVLGGTGGKVLA
jgi:NAD(P)-dependent dehydrogenase (short-subunit alcohol dehydrogenase family)